MNNKDFQNGVALGLAMGGVVEVPAKDEQEKTATITENGMVEVLPDENMALSKVTVAVNVPNKEEHEKTITITENGTTEILPDENKALSKVTVVTEIESDGNSADEPVFEIETLSTTLPHNLHASATARVGDKIYMFGGYNSADASRTNTILIYDINNDVLSYSTQTLGENINDFPAVVVGTDIYTFGGNKGSGNTIGKIYKYDTLTDTLEHYDSFITSVCSCAACYYNGYVYIFGGQNSSTYFNTIYRYDIANKTSELLDITLPQKTMGITSSGVLVGDVFYIFGGTSSSTNTSGYNTIYAIDLLNQTVDTLDFVLPYGARDISAIYHDGAIYMFGGKSSSVKSDMLVFKPDYEGVRFISGMLPSATCNINISRYNNKIYLIGGEGLKTISVVSIEEAEETTLSVEYIESTGTQYIDTGYVPKANTKIVLRYARNGTQSEESIFGTSWSLNAFFLMHYQGNLRWHGKTASIDIPESGLSDFREVSVYGTNITVNGTSYTLSGNGNDTQSDTLRIFGVGDNNSRQPLGKLKLYELKIYEYNSNTDSFDLVRNYKPKQSKESGHENEVCLFDNVTKAYFYNQGSGMFQGRFIEKVGIEPLDHTVTFTVDGEPYEVVSVKDGNEVNAPTKPTKDGMVLIGWLIDGAKQELPFVPVSDIELVGYFSAGTKELEKTNTDVFLQVDYYAYSKANNEVSVLGKYFLNGYTNPLVVSRTYDGALITRNGNAVGGTPSTISIDGETWYWYCGYGHGTEGSLMQDNTVDINKYVNDVSFEEAAQTLIKIYLGYIPLIEEPTGTYSERMYNHFGVDIAEFPYLLIRVKDTLAYAFFFTGRGTDSLGGYTFTTVRDLQIEIDEGADISAIIKEFESRDSKALPSATNNMLSQELEGYTYYANFDYAELGYSGIGTWETLE